MTSTIKLPFTRPYDWPEVLNFLRMRRIDGIELVEGECWRRRVSIGEDNGIIAVQPASKNALELTIPSSLSRYESQLVTQVTHCLDLKHDCAAMAAAFADDEYLAPLVEQWPGLRLPNAWSPWECLVRAIIGQQISVKAASTILARLVAAAGVRLDVDELPCLFPTPKAVLNTELTALGLTKQRASYLHNLAQAIVDGDLDLDAKMTLEQRHKALCAIKGIGPWTAQYVCMRAYRYNDAFPAGDLVLQKVAGKGERMKENDLEALSQQWRPYRAYATLYLWRSAV